MQVLFEALKMLRWSRRVLVGGLLGVIVCGGLAYPQERPSAQSNGDRKWQIVERIGTGYVASEEMPVKDLPAPKRNLSKAEQLENFDILWEAIDRHYSFFDLKNIDWQQIRKRYRARVKAVTGDDEYYALLWDLVKGLKDSHCWFQNYQKETLPGWACPAARTCLIAGKAVVTHVDEGSEAFAKGLRPGAVITHVDGLTVVERIEQIRQWMAGSSSERYIQTRAHFCLLCGKWNSQVRVTFLPPHAKASVGVTLQRNAPVRLNSWEYRVLPFPVEKGKFVWSGTHPSGYGYIGIVSFNGREEIADEFDRALERLKDTPGLIIDVRDNAGGSAASQSRIIGRLIAAKTRGGTCFRKSGPGHQEFMRRAHEISPCGDWQYSNPVALLMNTITGSASDVFACDMRGTGRVITVGTTTHGNLPGHNVYAVLPCGLVVRISNAYVTDIEGRIIEVNGNEPRIHAEPTVKDVIKGTDSVLNRAVQALRAANPRPERKSNRPRVKPKQDTALSKPAVACDGPNGVGTLPGQSSSSATNPRGLPDQREALYDQVLPLEFTLTDAYGREVRASDYRGVPVLIATGAGWCAHCQGDAEPLRLLEEKYRARGLQIIRSVCYDNNLPAWELQKRYRLPFVQLLDPIREFDSRYNHNGWAFFMVVDSEGRVIFRKNIETSDYWSELTGLLDRILPERSLVRTVQREGVSYMPETVKRSGETTRLRPIDRFPSVACGEDGRVYVAFTTNRGGTQDVYLRVFNGKKWLPDRPVAASDADEFDGQVIVDQQNRPWVAWTSNAAGHQYDIFVARAAARSGRISPIQLTHCDPKDGAMHPRMAVDARGCLWITYYHWERLREIPFTPHQFSLTTLYQPDKEVYTRYLEQDRWSDEIHVSPEDNVPTDDHADPVIAPLGDGVVIGWSWDFHQRNMNRSYSNNGISDQPSIFLRKVEPGPTFERARAISGPNIDSRPTIAVVPDGRVFCVWESVVRDRNIGRPWKTVAASVEDLQHEEQPGVGTNVTGPQKDICTPCLAASPNGRVTLVWSELDSNGHWMLQRAHWHANKNVWTAPRTLVSKGNPRFPSAAYSADDVLWVACCIDKGNRREVVVVKAD